MDSRTQQTDYPCKSQNNHKKSLFSPNYYAIHLLKRQNTSFASNNNNKNVRTELSFFCNFFYSSAINMYKRKWASVRIHHISALLVSYTWILLLLFVKELECIIHFSIQISPDNLLQGKNEHKICVTI